MDTRKAYGVVTAIGAKLGERARDEPDLVAALRATPDIEAFRALVREKADARAPAALVAQFLDDIISPDDWVQWKSRLLLQVKLTRDGGKPAPGHEAGRGVGKP